MKKKTNKMISKFGKKLKKIFKGFTLVELLAVIVILAVIMIIAIPSVLGTMGTAKEKAFTEYIDKVNSLTIQKSLESKLLSSAGNECTLYNINELGLSSTGDYKGYTVYCAKENSVYVTLTDLEYTVYNYKYGDTIEFEDTSRLSIFSTDDELDNFLYEVASSSVKCDTASSINSEESVSLYDSFIVGGRTFKSSLESLAGDVTNIEYIKRSYFLDDTSNNIAKDTNGEPIYIWYKDNTVYWYTKANKIYLDTGEYMFYGYTNLINADILDYVRVDNVISIESMFRGCKSLEKIDVSNWNTKNLANLNFAFYDCQSVEELDVSNWDTSSLNAIDQAFNSMVSVKELNLASWDTSRVTRMSWVFNGCQSLTELDLSSWDTSKVENMRGMFHSTTNLKTLNISNFDTSNVTSMGYMFSGIIKLDTLDISMFDTSKVTDMSYMFRGDSGLTNIYVGSKWNTSSVTVDDEMFYNCRKLKGYNSEKIGVSMATTDGYLTLKE